MSYCHIQPSVDVPLTPLNLRRALCCATEHHRGLAECDWGDVYRYNHKNARLYPNLYVVFPMQLSYDARLNNEGGKRLRIRFSFYILDRDGKELPDTLRDVATDKTVLFAQEICDKLRRDMERANWFFDETAEFSLIDDDANTEYFADDTTGVLVNWGVTGYPEACEDPFDCDDLLECCFCTEREPVPTDAPCCAFSIVITTNGAIGRPGEPGYLTSLVTFDDPECAVDPATLYYRWTFTPAVGDPYIAEEGVGAVGDIDWDVGTYTVEAWFVGNEDCRAEATATPPVDNPCCDALQVSLVEGGDFLELAIEFVPFLPECRFQISSIIIRRDGVIVSSGETTIANPPPGVYLGEVTLASGCIKQSNEVVVP